MILALAALATAIWIYLFVARGAFWLAAERQERGLPRFDGPWPAVTAIVPARDEAETIAAAVGSLLAQRYPGSLDVVLVDDGSVDATADLARKSAADASAGERLTVIEGVAPGTGWTGKVWALDQGFRLVCAKHEGPRYVLFSDADIVHAPSSLRDLVVRAETGGLVLVSAMARLRCVSFAERCAIPAFVYFFRMLYPFEWVNRPDRPTAAAAGGCMLVRAGALERLGGFSCIRDALIDDCALARRLAREGPIWLGLSDSVHSIRRYETFAPIARMVRRSAYAELRYSPLLLVAVVLAMALVFLAAPLLAIFASGLSALLGLIAWLLMVASYQPMARFYRINRLWGVALPLIAAMYMVWTVQSALEHASGRGGAWKGRYQASVGEVR